MTTHTHHHGGQSLTHDHEHGEFEHGYFEHKEDGHRPHVWVAILEFEDGSVDPEPYVALTEVAAERAAVARIHALVKDLAEDAYDADDDFVQFLADPRFVLDLDNPQSVDAWMDEYRQIDGRPCYLYTERTALIGA